MDASGATPRVCPLRVEGTIHQAGGADVREFAIMVSVRKAHGEEVSRQLLGVEAMHSSEKRTFVMAVNVFARPPIGAVLNSQEE